MADASTTTATTTPAPTDGLPPAETGATGSDADLVARLEGELEQARADLAAAKEEAARAERTRQLTALLAQARAIDLDAALLLAQRAIDGRPDADPAQAVRDLRRQKPHLFRAGPVLPRPDDTGADPSAAAARAARAGDRRALLDYLRARHGHRPTP